MFDNEREITEFFGSNGLLLDFIDTGRSTATSKEAAAALGCSVGQIGKTIVFDVEGEAVLVLLEGDRKVDTMKLENAIGKKAGRASLPFIAEKTGFKAGGVAPVNKKGISLIVIDKGVFSRDFLWVSAGSRTAVMKIKTAGLDKTLNAAVSEISC